MTNYRPLRRTWFNFWTMRKLRNQHRYCFLDSGCVGLWAHWRWWKAYWDSPKMKLFFEIVIKDKIAGYFSRTKTSSKVYEVGNLLLRTKFRKQGIMAVAIDWLTADPTYMYFAEVKEDNVPSRNVFIKTGFYKVGSKQHDGEIISIWLKGKKDGKEIIDLE